MAHELKIGDYVKPDIPYLKKRNIRIMTHNYPWEVNQITGDEVQIVRISAKTGKPHYEIWHRSFLIFVPENNAKEAKKE